MTNNYIIDYIQNSVKKSKEQQREFYLNEKINLYIKDPLTREVDVRNVMEKISAVIPQHLVSEIDSIFVGIFEEFEEMETNAMFKDGAIYVTNDQNNEEDMVDDIIHEIAHSLESPQGYLIYGDGKLQNEFLAKRIQLYEILKAEGLKPSLKLFADPDYSKEMDSFLYEDVGYDRLNFVVSSYGLFTSAYCATSLREYFANGFEYYFLDDRTYLAKICPQLYKKIEELHEYED
jgi:Mlc titration factor MtfA (ptsG expression regulator)